jgi:iron complex transport system substrate-binding protein
LVDRLIGLWWLGKVLYPAAFSDDLRPTVRDIYQRFYHVMIMDDQMQPVLQGRA